MCISNRTHSSLIQFAAYTSCIVNKHSSLWCENLDHGHDRYYNRTRRPMASLFSLWAHVRRGNYFYYLSVKLIVLNNIFDTRCIIAFGWMPHNITDGKSTLAQVIVWCRQVYVTLCTEWEPYVTVTHHFRISSLFIIIFAYIYRYICVCVCMMAYITEPLACLYLRLDATFKPEYSDATHATTITLSTSMKAQVSKPLYVAQFILSNTLYMWVNDHIYLLE